MPRYASHGNAGFTIIEAIVTVVLVGMMSAIAFPQAAKWMQGNRLDAAQVVVAGDLQNALSIAGRERKPVRIAWTSSTMSYAITDRVSGTSYRVRQLGTGSDFPLGSVAFSPTTVDVFPGGVASGPLTILLSWNGSTRTVTMTRAGLVRLP